MITTSKNISEIARFITSPQCNSIIVLTGAGISVSSGIPDFRSPGGMYDTLRPDLITAEPCAYHANQFYGIVSISKEIPSCLDYIFIIHLFFVRANKLTYSMYDIDQREMMKSDPTYVVEKEMFLSNSFPYLEVRRPFILGTREQKWKATLSHRFCELLHTKTKKLTRVYTQNIDGLYHQCRAIPKEKIVNVHGTISEVACEVCGTEMDFGEFCDKVQSSIKDIYKSDNQAPSESSLIPCKNCGKAAVKPKTVLFGSNLPSEFFECTEEDLADADLIIIAGTSLVVSPANSLVYRVGSKCLRMIVNKEQVGQELGINYGYEASCGRDYFAQGSCDEVFLDLIKELEWVEDLKKISHLLPQSSVDLL